MRKAVCVSTLLLGLLAGCASPPPDLPSGQAAYGALHMSNAPVQQEYRVGPLDTIAVTVFQEPDLSIKGLQVDSSGQVLMPLIGSIQASGLTTTELGNLIAQRLGQKYLRDPQVSVNVQSSASLRVTVEGAVKEPGVYQIEGSTTLVDALAMAKGPLDTAKLKEVVVFRTVGGKEMGAVFNLADIRRGAANNPEIVGRDRIVVGLDSLKSTWRTVLAASPFLNVFRPLAF